MDVESEVREALARKDVDAACAALIRGYGPQILGYLERVLGNGDDAGDAFSFFAERAWKGIAGFQGRSSVRVWAYHVAWTAALRVTGDAWRRRRERFATSMASRIAAEVRTEGARSAEAHSAEMERLRGVLTADEQSLLVLRLDRRLSWGEVAEIMAAEGRPLDEAALRKRFERLKAKLAKFAGPGGTGG